MRLQMMQSKPMIRGKLGPDQRAFFREIELYHLRSLTTETAMEAQKFSAL
jgi:hypothetical protein